MPRPHFTDREMARYDRTHLPPAPARDRSEDEWHCERCKTSATGRYCPRCQTCDEPMASGPLMTPGRIAVVRRAR